MFESQHNSLLERQKYDRDVSQCRFRMCLELYHCATVKPPCLSSSLSCGRFFPLLIQSSFMLWSGCVMLHQIPLYAAYFTLYSGLYMSNKCWLCRIVLLLCREAGNRFFKKSRKPFPAFNELIHKIANNVPFLYVKEKFNPNL